MRTSIYSEKGVKRLILFGAQFGSLLSFPAYVREVAVLCFAGAISGNVHEKCGYAGSAWELL